MNMTNIAIRIAALKKNLEDTMFKWSIAETKADTLINIDPHAEETVKAVKEYHAYRYEFLNLNRELNNCLGELR